MDISKFVAVTSKNPLEVLSKKEFKIGKLEEDATAFPQASKASFKFS
jgi:hypothetical protein